MATIYLKFSDEPTGDGDMSVRLEVSHENFDLVDSEGKELPATPAMRAAVALIEAFKLGPAVMGRILEEASSLNMDEDAESPVEG